jgi:16S rRNA (uracil1498-N3)-methyltransferase
MLKTVRSARTARFHHVGELCTSSELTLSKNASHHLVTVLRMRQGDVIELFNGDGYNYQATLIDTGQRTPARCAVLQVHGSREALTESPVATTLVQAISRGDRMDTTIRQSVELGVACIQPVYTRHSARPLDEKRTLKKQEHWQSVVVSACEQSGRAILPALATPVTLEQWLIESPACALPHHTVCILSPVADQSLVSHLGRYLPRDSHESLHDNSLAVGTGIRIALIIGAESGLDADETAMAISAGAHAVKVGPRILRTETAGPACIALVQATLGDLG